MKAFTVVTGKVMPLNRANVDEVNYVYGSPIACGALPLNYKDAVSQAIQTGAASTACPFAGPQVTPAGNTVVIPAHPSSVFGTPRTMLNPRQFQFAVKFSF